jgi:hypothetical protein
MLTNIIILSISEHGLWDLTSRTESSRKPRPEGTVPKIPCATHHAHLDFGNIQPRSNLINPQATPTSAHTGSKLKYKNVYTLFNPWTEFMFLHTFFIRLCRPNVWLPPQEWEKKRKEKKRKEVLCFWLFPLCFGAVWFQLRPRWCFLGLVDYVFFEGFTYFLERRKEVVAICWFVWLWAQTCQ